METEAGKKQAYEKAIDRPIAKFDINPFILDREKKVVLARRISTVQYGGMWHMPGGKVFVGERMPESLKRMTRLKTGLEIDLMFPTLNESVVGVYDDPKRDPREHVVGITFFCRVTGGTPRPDGNSDAVQSFSEKEAAGLELAFGHREMIADAFRKLRS